MTSDRVVCFTERIFALGAVEDGIGDLLATTAALREAAESHDVEQVVPAGAERLRHIEHETDALLKELLALKRDYVAELALNA